MVVSASPCRLPSPDARSASIAEKLGREKKSVSREHVFWAFLGPENNISKLGENKFRRRTYEISDLSDLYKSPTEVSRGCVQGAPGDRAGGRPGLAEGVPCAGSDSREARLGVGAGATPLEKRGPPWRGWQSRAPTTVR